MTTIHDLRSAVLEHPGFRDLAFHPELGGCWYVGVVLDKGRTRAFWGDNEKQALERANEAIKAIGRQ